MPNVDLTVTLKHLQETAAAQAAQRSQHTGHFEDYRLVRLTEDVTTREGLAFKKGEYAIAIMPPEPKLPSSGKFATVWSRRNKIGILVHVTVVEWLGA